MARRSRTPAQTFALVVGVIYLAIGLVGFASTGFEDFAGVTKIKLLAFHINPLHNLVHIALGVAWLVSSSTHSNARRTNLILGAVLVAVGLVGLVDTPIRDALNIHTAGDPDNFLHLGTGVLSFFFATWAATELRTSRA